MNRNKQMSKKLLMSALVALPLLLMLTGCQGGVNGEGGNTYTATGGTPIIRSAGFNDAAWSLIDKGQYESAISQFNSVLADSPTQDEMTEAYNGIGWARSRLGSLQDGMPWFEKAQGGSHDAKVGLAGAYVQLGSKTDLEKAYEILYKDLGNSNPHFHYAPRRNTGVSDAECHAVLAYVAAALGKTDEAQVQLDYAKELNPNWQGTTIEQISRMVDFLNR